MDESLKHFLQEVLLLSSEVVEICSKLGAMRSILAFSNLDRMRQSIEKDENFSKLSVIDADLLLWVRKFFPKIENFYLFSKNEIFYRLPNMFGTKKSCQLATLTN